MSKEAITPEVVVAQAEPELKFPSINVNVSTVDPAKQRQELAQAHAENIGKLCEEILDDIRQDRDQHIEVSKAFLDMVINDGDASNSSKEAAVALLKNMSDLADKKIKVMDLLMRSYLKESNTFPKFLAAHQHNQFNMDGGKRALLKSFKEEPKE